MEYKENKVFLPFVIVTTFVFLLILSIVFSGNINLLEHTKIIIILSIIWFIWLVLFIREKKKGAKIAERKEQLFIKLFFSVIISVYFANSIWFSWCLSINPINAILNCNLNQDTAFHATIAESIKNYGYPSILLNNANFLHYHFGSHSIMALLSIILNVSVFYIYNYFYPVIFIPIYSFLTISVIIEIRKYKKENTQLSVMDYIFLSFFFIGFIPTITLNRLGIWKTSWVVSESFLLALVFFLLYLFLVFLVNKNLAGNRWKNVSIFLLTSIFIFICSSMKISIGFLLSTGVIYLNFRMNTKKLIYWIANIVFLIIFFLSYKLFSETGNNDFQFLSFVRNYAMNGSDYGIIFHYFFLLFFTLFVLYYQLSVNTPLKNALITKNFIFEETLVIVSIASLLPGILLNIGGGSAVYFSYFQELIAICMLLGYNISGKLQQKVQAKSAFVRNGIGFIVILFSFVVLLNSEPRILITNRIMNFRNNTPINNLITNVQKINEITKKNKKKSYCIFLADNAQIWDYYKHNRRATIFFYPALTGIRIINGLNTDGTYIFLANGADLQDIESSSYGIDKNVVIEKINRKENFISKLTFDEAKEKARKNSYKYIIYLFDDKYEIIEIL
jgi:hypothetical protein